MMINVSRTGVSSSVLPMTKLHQETAPNSAYAGTESVQQECLDRYVLPRLTACASIPIKLDVQGYEAAVLEGATALLERTRVIQVELSLADVQDGQAEWRLLTGSLVRAGFLPWAIEPVLLDRLTGRTLKVDVVMARIPDADQAARFHSPQRRRAPEPRA